MKIAYIFLIIFVCNSVSTSQIALQDSSKPTVYLFLLEECVICQSYSNKINNIQKDFAQHFNFSAIFPSFISKPETIKKFLSDYDIQMPYKTDFYKTLVKKFDVKVTPEVVVFDHQQNKILYKGRIDNEFFAIGRKRRSGVTEDLRVALNQIISGKIVDPYTTEAIGCIINIAELEEDLHKK
jgi:thioredoxin-related protein